MVRKYVFLPILILFWMHTALAQGAPQSASQSAVAQPLPLDEAVRTALRQHPALREAEAAVAAAEAEVREARSYYFPQLSFSGIGKVGLSCATSAFGLPGFPASPFFRNIAYSVNWYQSIFDFGRIKHLVAMDRALYKSAQLKQMSEEQRIVLDVKRAYFSVLEAQRLHHVGEQPPNHHTPTIQQANPTYQED